MRRLRSAPWLLIVFASALATQGCATVIVPAVSALGSAFTLATWMNVQARNEQVRHDSLLRAEAESYRQGIRDTLEALQRNGRLPVVASPRQPDHLHYAAPVMQELWVPAQVVGGIVIPAHRQWVIVRPGAWRVAGGVPSLDGMLGGLR